MARGTATPWSKLGVQRRPASVSALLQDVANITVATGHRYVWRGVKDARHTLHSALSRRFQASGEMEDKWAVIKREAALLRQARDAGFGFHGGRELLDGDLLARLQHAGASTSLLDVTPDPFVALFFATEPTDEVKPCALFAIKVPGKTEAEQSRHTLKGPLPNDGDEFATIGTVGIYDRLLEELDLADNTLAPILWEAPFVDDRMRAQRGMFIATPPSLVSFGYASFEIDLDDRDKEETRVDHLCKRSRGKYTRPSLVVFYVSAELRKRAARALDQRFGYRTETIYPDLAGFALANAWNRRFAR